MTVFAFWTKKEYQRQCTAIVSRDVSRIVDIHLQNTFIDKN